ncbi:endonuclease/exonuclease/phosphatase family protein [Candidatus Amarolinea dominans]|uniref:endonuclease/exonuclease/phosphatase family protein n=1 Tax=Candidatus Amarolinea dominans TaxID=3140696 RepID=UPI001D1C3F23|nr:endonuclease/exonuclease/phosphatase family protein [Anaerolineae bacterium]
MPIKLGMYAYYGPKTVAGTFGIALLSRFPIENPRTYYLFSEGEQVAVIAAQITVGDRTFEVFVNHLGNGGPLIQQQQLLELMAGRTNVIALGDFNFRPDSEQYRLTTQQLADSWTLRWPAWRDDQGQQPQRKIDHIFVSAGTDVRQARFIPSPASDHPAVTATIGW